MPPPPPTPGAKDFGADLVNFIAYGANSSGQTLRLYMHQNAAIDNIEINGVPASVTQEADGANVVACENLSAFELNTIELAVGGQREYLEMQPVLCYYSTRSNYDYVYIMFDITSGYSIGQGKAWDATGGYVAPGTESGSPTTFAVTIPVSYAGSSDYHYVIGAPPNPAITRVILGYAFQVHALTGSDIPCKIKMPLFKEIAWTQHGHYIDEGSLRPSN